jgi:hypothetical protein
LWNARRENARPGITVYAEGSEKRCYEQNSMRNFFTFQVYLGLIGYTHNNVKQQGKSTTRNEQRGMDQEPSTCAFLTMIFLFFFRDFVMFWNSVDVRFGWWPVSSSSDPARVVPLQSFALGNGSK